MSIANSLRKAGYLSIGAEGLAKFLNKLRSNQQEEEIAKASIDTYKKLKELFAPEPQFEEPKQTSITVLSKEGLQQEIPFEEPSIQIYPDYIPPEKRKTKSREYLADYLDKISSIKGIDPDRIKQEFSFMHQRANLLQPEGKNHKLEQLDPTKITVKVDDNGNIIPVYSPTEKPRRKQLEKIGEYVGTDGFKRFVFLDSNGNIKEEVAGTRTRYENTNPPQAKQVGLPEIGDILNNINYKQDENGNLIPTTEKEKAIRRKIGLNNAKKLLHDEAFAWHNNEILGKWGREDISFEDYNYEVKKALERGEITVEAAQELINFNAYRVGILDAYDRPSIYKDKILKEFQNNNSESKTKKQVTTKAKQ